MYIVVSHPHGRSRQDCIYFPTVADTARHLPQHGERRFAVNFQQWHVREHVAPEGLHCISRHGIAWTHRNCPVDVFLSGLRMGDEHVFPDRVRTAITAVSSYPFHASALTPTLAPPPIAAGNPAHSRTDLVPVHAPTHTPPHVEPTSLTDR